MRADNTTIAAIQNKNNALSFSYLAKSARVFFNPQKEYKALNIIPFIKEFDEEMFTIKGLDANKNYSLKIDGRLITNFSGASLGEGINVAILSNTPQYQQAKKVAELQLKRKNLEDKMRAFYFISYDLPVR